MRAELGDAAAARLAVHAGARAWRRRRLVSFREPRFARGTRVLRAARTAIAACSCCTRWGCSRPGSAPLAEPPGRLLQRRCCRAPYLRGAFVAAGSVSAPRAPGHLEIRVAELDGCRAASPGRAAPTASSSRCSVARRGHAIAYAKSKPAIRELLAHMGAHDAVAQLDEAEVISAPRAGQPRHQLRRGQPRPHGRGGAGPGHAIAALDLQGLDARLREVAALRLRHPHLSLAELGRRARPPLPKIDGAGRMRALTRERPAPDDQVVPAELGLAVDALPRRRQPLHRPAGGVDGGRRPRPR